MTLTLSDIKEKKAAGASPEEIIAMLNTFLNSHPDSDEAYTLRGLAYWSTGNRAEAIRDYLAAIRINPKSKASLALNSTNQILDYYNKDLYNP